MHTLGSFSITTLVPRSVCDFGPSSDTGNVGLSAETSFGTDFAGDACDFAGECVQLIDHGVDGFFQLEDLAADVDGDLS